MFEPGRRAPIRVSLVKPVSPITFIDVVGPDLGLGLVVSGARRAGWEPQLVDCHVRRLDQEALLSQLRAFGPDVVGFKVFTKDIPSVADSIQRVRAALPGALVVVGGPLPSAIGIGTAAWLDDVDLLIKGEADRSFPRLLEVLEPCHRGGAWSLDTKVLSGIPGLGYRDDEGGWVQNPQDTPEDLDDLGLPDWDSYDFERDFPIWSSRCPAPYIPVQTGRGCPFECRFCSVDRINGRRTRKKSHAFVIEELRYLHERYGVDHVSMVDDNFLGGRRHILGLMDRIRRESPIRRWECSTNGIRLNQLVPEIVESLDTAGCYYVALGIESGVDRVLALMRKSIDTAAIRRYVDMIRAHSRIQMHGFFILGYPGETRQEMWQTLDFAYGLPIHSANFFWFTPHPGTPAFEQLVAEGRIDPDADPSQFVYEQPTLSAHGLSETQMRALLAYAHLRFHADPRKVTQTLRHVITPQTMRPAARALWQLLQLHRLSDRIRSRV